MALQIQGKFIASEAIDGEKLLLSSGQAIRLVTASGEVRLIELDESTGKVKVNGVEVALQPDLAAEIARALAAEGVLAADLAAEVAARAAADSALATAVQSVIEAETAARVAADSALSSSLSTEVTNRIAGDAATLSSAQAYADQKVADLVASAPAVLDTLKELSDALGGDANFASTISAQIGAANAAVEAEELRAMTAESLLQGEVDAVESALAQEVLDRASAVAAEQSRAEGIEASLQSQINALTGGGSGGSGLSLSSLDERLEVLEGGATVEGSVAKAEADAKAYTDAEVLDEKTRAEGVEASLSSAISAEQSARQTADSALSARLDTVEGVGEGSVAKAEADAKAYADLKIAELVNSAPAVLDTLKELSDAIAGDANFAATVAAQIGSVSGDVEAEEARALAAEAELAGDIAQEILDRAAAITATATSSQAMIQLEADARVAADNALDGRLDVIEARAFYKMKFVLTAQDLANGYIELGHEAMPSSIVASVGRLMIHEGSAEDYTVSVVAGKTQMAFVGNLVHPSEEELAVGDVIFVRYMA